MDDVRLPDLETIRRFSIAVRSEHAPAEEVLEALQSDIAMVQKAVRGRAAPARPAKTRSSGARTTSSRSTRRR